MGPEVVTTTGPEGGNKKHAARRKGETPSLQRRADESKPADDLGGRARAAPTIYRWVARGNQLYFHEGDVDYDLNEADREANQILLEQAFREALAGPGRPLARGPGRRDGRAGVLRCMKSATTPGRGSSSRRSHTSDILETIGTRHGAGIKRQRDEHTRNNGLPPGGCLPVDVSPDRAGSTTGSPLRHRSPDRRKRPHLIALGGLARRALEVRPARTSAPSQCAGPGAHRAMAGPAEIGTRPHLNTPGRSPAYGPCPPKVNDNVSDPEERGAPRNHGQDHPGLPGRTPGPRRHF